MVKVRNHLLYGYKEYVMAWAAEHMPDVDEFGPGNAIGVLSDDGQQLIAGVVYTDWQPRFQTIQLHVAAVNPMWAQKPLIKALLAYPFYELGVYKCWVAVPSTNAKSLKFTRKIGFKEEGTLAHQFGRGRHAVMGRMFKPDFNRLYGDLE